MVKSFKLRVLAKALYRLTSYFLITIKNLSNRIVKFDIFEFLGMCFCKSYIKSCVITPPIVHTWPSSLSCLHGDMLSVHMECSIQVHAF